MNYGWRRIKWGKPQAKTKRNRNCEVPWQIRENTMIQSRHSEVLRAKNRYRTKSTKQLCHETEKWAKNANKWKEWWKGDKEIDDEAWESSNKSLKECLRRISEYIRLKPWLVIIGFNQHLSSTFQSAFSLHLFSILAWIRWTSMPLQNSYGERLVFSAFGEGSRQEKPHNALGNYAPSAGKAPWRY